MKWFKLYANLKDHPKRWRFEELADTEHGLHYITLWFSYVCSYATDGDISSFTPREVARACEWKGAAQVFWDALIGAGFIDKTENGLQAHDWAHENSRFIEENKKRTKPKENPRVAQVLPLLEEKVREKKNKTTSAGADSDFMIFYKAYPKKKSPGDAEKAWNQMKPPLQDVLAALAWQSKQEDWSRDSGKWTPYPATYLRKRQWQDEKPGWAFREARAPAAPLQVHQHSMTKILQTHEDGSQTIECETCSYRITRDP